MLRGPEVGDLPVVSFAVPSVEPPPADDLEPVPPDEVEPADTPPELDVDEIYQRGWEAGHEAGLASLEARRAHAVHLLEEAVGAIDVALRQHQREADELAVDLALELTRLLLDRELAVAADPGRDALLRCLGEIPNGRRTTIRLHPDDLRHLDDRDSLLAGRECDLVADPTLQPGDAVVDVDGGSVDGRLSAALARVTGVLKP